MGRWKMARHLMAVDHELRRIAAGKLKYLAVEMPPRHGKTELIGRFFPAWFLGLYPDKQVIYVSNEQRQASKYGRLVRNTLNEFGWMFPVQVAGDSSAAIGWSIQGREGGMQAVGVKAQLAGKQANMLIIDDPIGHSGEAVSEIERSNLWEWFESTAMQRMEPDAAVIVIMHRWNDDDLSGRFQKTYARHGVKVLRMPAIAEEEDGFGRAVGEPLWPQRWPLTSLIEKRETMSMFWWLALFQQRPGRGGAVLWPDEYFNWDGFWFDTWPEDLHLRAIALDPSKGKGKHSDYSAMAMVGADRSGELWIDADLKRRPPGQIVEDACDLIRLFEPHAFGIESNAFQELFLPMLREAAIRQKLTDTEIFYGLNNSLKKELRIQKLDPWLRGRMCHFRKTAGCKLLVEQLREFPLGQHDDGPDALEMTIRLMSEVGQAFDDGPPEIPGVENPMFR